MRACPEQYATKQHRGVTSKATHVPDCASDGDLARTEQQLSSVRVVNASGQRGTGMGWENIDGHHSHGRDNATRFIRARTPPIGTPTGVGLRGNSAPALAPVAGLWHLSTLSDLSMNYRCIDR